MKTLLDYIIAIFFVCAISSTAFLTALALLNYIAQFNNISQIAAEALPVLLTASCVIGIVARFFANNDTS